MLDSNYLKKVVILDFVFYIGCVIYMVFCMIEILFMMKCIRFIFNSVKNVFMNLKENEDNEVDWVIVDKGLNDFFWIVFLVFEMVLSGFFFLD